MQMCVKSLDYNLGFGLGCWEFHAGIMQGHGEIGWRQQQALADSDTVFLGAEPRAGAQEHCCCSRA